MTYEGPRIACVEVVPKGDRPYVNEKAKQSPPWHGLHIEDLFDQVNVTLIVFPRRSLQHQLC